jgi:preprotein translocase subunit SecG
MLLADISQYFFGVSIFVASGFLILLVLVQRGRGGGLTGALGGPGGQSAFGTKAGDLFTKITIGVATVWIFLCAAAVYFLKAPPLPSTGLTGGASVGSTDTGADEEATAPATVTPSGDEAASESDDETAGDDAAGEASTEETASDGDSN